MLMCHGNRKAILGHKIPEAHAQDALTPDSLPDLDVRGQIPAVPQVGDQARPRATLRVRERPGAQRGSSLSVPCNVREHLPLMIIPDDPRDISPDRVLQARTWTSRF